MHSATGIPLLGFGTFPLKGDDAKAHVLTALELGYRHVDTAQMYGNEADVGRAIAASGIPRADLFVVTKIEPGNLAAGRFERSLDASIADLQGPPDLLLMHWPPPDAEFDAVVDRLLAAQEDGKAKAIGISNCSIALMRRAQQQANGALVCNQVEFHPLIDQRPLLAEARALGMTLAAYCPLARGAALEPEVVQAIARKLGRPASEIVLRWIVQQGVAAIPMTTRRANAASNARVFGFALADEAMAAISGLGAANRRLINPPSMAGRW